jgi:hyperosmotically inducible protein
LANRAAEKAGDAADKVGDRMTESALTAKIKSKMALDDHVKANAINVDTSGSVVTLSGRVASKGERDRALRLARDTAGVSRVVDRLQVR